MSSPWHQTAYWVLVDIHCIIRQRKPGCNQKRWFLSTESAQTLPIVPVLPTLPPSPDYSPAVGGDLRETLEQGRRQRENRMGIESGYRRPVPCIP